MTVIAFRFPICAVGGSEVIGGLARESGGADATS
jgi:hypothetical protein